MPQEGTIKTTTTEACNGCNLNAEVIEELQNTVIELDKEVTHMKENGVTQMKENERTQTKINTGNEFIKVTNGVRPKVRENFTMPTFNPFAALEQDEQEGETFFLGSSLIKQMEVEFVLRNDKKRKVKIVPEAKIQDIINEIENLNASETLLATTIGENDVYVPESSVTDLVDKYKSLILSMKEKSKNVLCIGVLPRTGSSLRLLSKAIFFNTKLEKLCNEENVHFINFWDRFSNERNLYSPDGVHLSDIGNSRLGCILDKEIRKIHANLKLRPTQNEPQDVPESFLHQLYETEGHAT